MGTKKRLLDMAWRAILNSVFGHRTQTAIGILCVNAEEAKQGHSGSLTVTGRTETGWVPW